MGQNRCKHCQSEAVIKPEEWLTVYDCGSVQIESITWQHRLCKEALGSVRTSSSSEDRIDTMAMSVDFAKGAIKSGEEKTLTVEEYIKLSQSAKEEVNPCLAVHELYGSNERRIKELTMPEAENHDEHYSSKKIEPIDIIEEVEDNLIKAGCPANEAANIVRGLKYVLRAGTKEGEPWEKDLRKYYNYTHRARTGSWLS